MKAKYLVVLLLISAQISPLLHSADVEGFDLSIGLQNSNVVNNTLGGAIGMWNEQTSDSSVLLVGNENVSMESLSSLFVGWNNSSIRGADGFPDDVACTAIVGAVNFVTSSFNSLVVGENNYLGAGQSVMLHGRGLIYTGSDNLQYNPKVIVGLYNKTINNPLFVVANGTSAATGDRKNALEVLQDGTVRIPKRQGDVGMGRFGYTADQ